MKLDGVQTNSPVKAPVKAKDGDKNKKFSALLEEKKKQPSPDDPAAGDLPAKEFPPKDLLAGQGPGQGPGQNLAGTSDLLNKQTAKTEETKAVASPRMLDKLADEISVVTRESGVKEVQIQLNSKTLEGLKINISRQDGGIQVQFQTQSPQVQEMLQGQTAQLADRLAAKGLTVASISVNRKPGDLRVNASRSQDQGPGESRKDRPRSQ